MIRPPSCPICEKPLSLDAEEARKWFPFCGDRCKKVDFYRWLDGRYAIVEPLTPENLPPELLDPDEPEEGAG